MIGTDFDDDDDDVRPEESLSVAGRPLPLPLPLPSVQSSSLPSEDNGTSTGHGPIGPDIGYGDGGGGDGDGGGGGGSIVLFYQYKEPMWTDSEFGRALKLFLQICNNHQMKGRGRIAKEGVNCTLSNASPTKMRSFCNSLRDPSVWTINDSDSTSDSDKDKDNDDNEQDGDRRKRKRKQKTTLFEETDFKITDGVPSSKLFKSLTVRKVDELVAYGLEGPDKAPSIKKFGGTHLTAIDYHDALKDPNTVVIDVRNAYETAIGTIRPPPGGATLLDPKMRNSHEWPKWLASKETQRQLHGKKVLTFCTGTLLFFRLQKQKSFFWFFFIYKSKNHFFVLDASVMDPMILLFPFYQKDTYLLTPPCSSSSYSLLYIFVRFHFELQLMK